MIRSIPPANRRGPTRLSSMRAATASGFIFVGQHSRPHTAQDDFHPHVIVPDQEERRTREVYRETMAAYRERIRELITDLRSQNDRYLEDEAALLEEDLQRRGQR